MVQLFGFEISRKKQQDQEEKNKSFALPQNDDGAVTIQSGAYYGTYVDLDGVVRNEIELITRYREMAMQPELETAIDEIVNEAINSSLDDTPVQIELSNLDSRIIDYPDTTPYSKVLHYISNPKLDPYIKPNLSSISTTLKLPLPPSPPSLPSSILRPNIKLDLLKNINNGSFKLKKVEKDVNDNKDNNNMQNIKDKILNTVNNTNGLKVPTLFDIQGALSKLKKVVFIKLLRKFFVVN